MCAAALNAPDRRTEILIPQWAKRDVYVIGHQHPGAQFIPGLPHSFLTTPTPLPDTASRSWSNSTNLGPSLVQESGTMVTGREPSSRQVTKYAEPGREECSNRRWKSISTKWFDHRTFSPDAFPPDLANTRLKSRVYHGVWIQPFHFHVAHAPSHLVNIRRLQHPLRPAPLRNLEHRAADLLGGSHILRKSPLQQRQHRP